MECRVLSYPAKKTGVGITGGTPGGNVHGLLSPMVGVLGVEDKGALVVADVGGDAGCDVVAMECEVHLWCVVF